MEAVCQAASEHYLALGLDLTASRLTLVGSDAGGTSIESVAGEQPERFSQVTIDPGGRTERRGYAPPRR